IDEVSNFGLPSNVDTLKLPGLRKVADNHYCSRRLGLPGEDIRKVRSALLEATVTSFRPNVILVDKQPFGAEKWVYLAQDFHSSRPQGALVGPGGGGTAFGSRAI